MSSDQQQRLLAAPRPSFANLHQPQQTEDFALARNGGNNEARAGTSTARAATRSNPAVPSFVPAAGPGATVDLQATTFRPRPTPNPHQHGRAQPKQPKSALTLRANVFFKSEEFRKICAEAIRRAVDDFLPSVKDELPTTPVGPPPQSWQAKPAEHQKPHFYQEPLHPWWSGLLERFRWAMLERLWERREGREWVAWRIGGGAEGVGVGEWELWQQLERGIRGAQEFEMRRARRFWLGEPEGEREREV